LHSSVKQPNPPKKTTGSFFFFLLHTWSMPELPLRSSLYLGLGGRRLTEVACSCYSELKWVFPRIGVPQNGWFMMEILLKWMIWGYHYFWKHPYLNLTPTQSVNLPPTTYQRFRIHPITKKRPKLFVLSRGPGSMRFSKTLETTCFPSWRNPPKQNAHSLSQKWKSEFQLRTSRHVLFVAFWQQILSLSKEV